VPPGDADALAAALRAVLTDQDLYQDLKSGAAGARRCLPDWTAATRLFALEIEGVSQP
jgi:hypothetical protein